MDRLLTEQEKKAVLDEVEKFHPHMMYATALLAAQAKLTAAIVRAEECAAVLREVGEWLDSHHHFGGPKDYYVEVTHRDIEALARGEAPAGWPEKEG